MNADDEDRLDRLEEAVREAITPPVEEARIVALEEAVSEAGVAGDKPHTAMAVGVAEATVKASEKHQASMVSEMHKMMSNAKWFIVILVVAFFVVYLAVR